MIDEGIYSDEARNKALRQQAEAMERQAEAMERQAESLQLIAGMLMLRYHYHDEAAANFTAEAMEKEARFFARGGGL